MLHLLLVIAMAISPISPTTLPSANGAFQDAIRLVRHDSLPICPLLQSIAQVRVSQIELDFSHWSKGAEEARRPLASWTWGEILAWNSYPDSLAVSGAIGQFMGSPGHRSVLLGRWHCFGAAAQKWGGRWWFVALFGIPPKSVRPPVRAVRPPPRVAPPRVAAPPPRPLPLWLIGLMHAELRGCRPITT